jgi:hypothetical protein
MNKKTILTTILIIVLAGYIAYTEGAKFYQSQKTLWLNTGALQMREAIFQAVDKGEVQLSDAKGEKTITIIKK